MRSANNDSSGAFLSTQSYRFACGLHAGARAAAVGQPRAGALLYAHFRSAPPRGTRAELFSQERVEASPHWKIVCGGTFATCCQKLTLATVCSPSALQRYRVEWCDDTRARRTAKRSIGSVMLLDHYRPWWRCAGGDGAPPKVYAQFGQHPPLCRLLVSLTRREHGHTGGEPQRTVPSVWTLQARGGGGLALAR